VTKTIAGRAYRYQVERVRDPATGKRRSRWTYLGRAEAPPAKPAAPRRPSNAPQRLLDALERLLADREFGAIATGAIATEAGLAHGTFYRHFRDKRAAMRAALERMRERRGPAIASLHVELATEEEARAGMRAFVTAMLRTPAEHRALLRAIFELSVRDEEIARERRERRAAAVRLLADHFAALAARGFTAVPHPEATAAALLAMIDGLYREAIVEGPALDDARIAAAATIFERAVFPDPARKENS
jgi:AcrR family transcriptional regulator